MKVSVIVPAAGVGKRFASSSPAAGNAQATASKIELPLGDRPVFLRSIELFIRRPDVVQVILAVNPDTLDDFRFRWGDKLGFHGVKLVAGGKTERWETVLKALAAVDDRATHIAIHDAARPLASVALIDRVFAAAAEHGAVIPGLPVAATLKRVAAVKPRDEAADPLDAILGSAGKQTIEVKQVVGTVDRSELVEVQTPQVFERGLLTRAYAPLAAGKHDGRGITDDAGLVEALGQTVFVVEGEAINFKITRPQDLKLAEAWVKMTDQQQAAAAAKKRLFADDDDER
jgi:2-C-methyl-D-erythritol 4-phosphate cytidylyltransferase